MRTRTLTSMLICVCILLTTNTLIAQRQCSTDEYHQQQMQDPDFAKQYLKLKQQVQERIANGANRAAGGLNIPVAVHYNDPVTDADQQCLIDAAQAQIDQLNLDYSSCNMNAGLLCDWINAGCTEFGPLDAMPPNGTMIQFYLADQNLPAGEDNIGGLAITVGDYTWPSVPGNTWDGYLNIFVSDGATAGIGGGVLGVAPLGGAANPNGNGVFVSSTSFGSQAFAGCTSGGGLDTAAPYDGGATCTHEVGHYFGLEHTWVDDLADTPEHTEPNFGCPSVDPSTCTCTGDCDGYAGNYMDYVDDDCMFVFTDDQVDVMCNTAAAQTEWAENSISSTQPYTACNGACVVCLVENPVATVECNGDNADVTVCFDVDGGSGDYNLIDKDNGDAVLASITGGDATATGICFAVQTITGPTSDGTMLNWAVTDVNETPACEDAFTVTLPDCPVQMECASSSQSLVPNELCTGESFSIIVTNFESGDGSVDVDDADGDGDPTTGTDIMDDLLVLYDLDPSTTETLQEIYDDLTGVVDDPDLEFFGEIGLSSDGFADFNDLNGFTNNTCEPLPLALYIVPVYGEEGIIEPTCQVEGPVEFEILPDPAAGLALDITDCTYTITTDCVASQITFTNGTSAGATITGTGTNIITYAPAEGDAATTLDVSIVNGLNGGNGLPCERVFTLAVDAYEAAEITGCPTETVCLDENPSEITLSAVPECVETASVTFVVQLTIDNFCTEVSFELTDSNGDVVTDNDGNPVSLSPCAADGSYAPYGTLDNPITQVVTVQLPDAASGTYTVGNASGLTFSWEAGDQFDSWSDTAFGGNVDGGYLIVSADGQTTYASGDGTPMTGTFDPLITAVQTCSSSWTVATDVTVPTDAIGDGADTATFDPNAAGAGTYDITYTYTDNNGCESTTTCSIEVVETCNCDAAIAAATAPVVVVMSESTCESDNTTLSGGVLSAPTTTCPTGSTLMYSTDGGTTYSDQLPTYDQENAITVTTICECDLDNTVVSATSEVTTVPGTCPTCDAAIAAATAPVVVVMSESTCESDNTTLSGGVLSAPTTTCPTGSTLMYSTDGGTTYSDQLPTYDQENAITVTTICECNIDDTVVSATSEVTTVPGVCIPPATVSISDPCVCNDDADTNDPATFNETVTVDGNPGDVWSVTSSTGILGTVTATEVTAGSGDYTFTFEHADGVGYYIELSNGTTSLYSTNICKYPNASFTVAGSYCEDDATDYDLTTLIMENSTPVQPGTALAIMVDGVATTTFNPSTLGAGTYAIVASYDGTGAGGDGTAAGNATDAYAGDDASVPQASMPVDSDCIDHIVGVLNIVDCVQCNASHGTLEIKAVPNNN